MYRFFQRVVLRVLVGLGLCAGAPPHLHAGGGRKGGRVRPSRTGSAVAVKAGFRKTRPDGQGQLEI